MTRSIRAGVWECGLLLGAAMSIQADEPAGKPPAGAPPRVAPVDTIVRLQDELPETVIDRLKIPVTAKFTLPLELAFQELFATVNVKCVVDGASLKSSGITKNEVQKLSHENKPLYQVIQAILERPDRKQTYPDLALCIDEEKKTVTLTTRKSAETQKLETLDFEQFRPRDKKTTDSDRS